MLAFGGDERAAQAGCAPLTGAADVLASFGIEPEPERRRESPLLELLPASADELVRKTGLGAGEVARASSSSSSKVAWPCATACTVALRESVLAGGTEPAAGRDDARRPRRRRDRRRGRHGLLAALRLAEAGLRVRVHDARGIAEGASGRNGGFALGGGAARYDVARETYGAERAAATGAGPRGARPDGRVRRRCPCAPRQLPPCRRRGGARGIRLEYEALREDGFDGGVARRRPRRGGRPLPRRDLASTRRLDPAGALRATPRRARGGGRSRDPRARRGRGRRRARRRPRPRGDRRLRARSRPRTRRPDLADPRPGDRERAARPRALRPPALRASGLRLLAAAPRRPDPARRLPRRLDPRRADRRRGDDADDPGLARVVPPRARRRGGGGDAPLGRASSA